ncbi:MAG: DUF1287 domain-containing protein [Bdellovibrionaceae bacterium]|nr:DUF1287 domain-containing protein [Pseudobdellovibrionaceae bacterium]
MRRTFRVALLASLVLSGAAVFYLSYLSPRALRSQWVEQFVRHYQSNLAPRRMKAADCDRLLARARLMVESEIRYVADYVEIPFPEGDVAPDTGVCADVVVRSFREIGIDLQERVNRELKRDFASSPQIWGLEGPDTNIDHRRVPNLMWYFTREWSRRPLSEDNQDYRRCDVVAWDLGGGVTHIGIVSGVDANGETQLIHHLAEHPQEQAVLRRWRIIGHFAY